MNMSPLQMWEMGMLENINSGNDALSSTEIEEFGLDPESVLAVEDEDYQVQVCPPEVILAD